MATFYLLPSRPRVGACLAQMLQTLLPGQSWTSEQWTNLADAIALTIPTRPDVFLVFAEELAEGKDPREQLCQGFGAEPGDEIIEVAPEVGQIKRWRLDAAHAAHTGKAPKDR